MRRSSRHERDGGRGIDTTAVGVPAHARGPSPAGLALASGGALMVAGAGSAWVRLGSERFDGTAAGRGDFVFWAGCGLTFLGLYGLLVALPRRVEAAAAITAVAVSIAACIIAAGAVTDPARSLPSEVATRLDPRESAERARPDRSPPDRRDRARTDRRARRRETRRRSLRTTVTRPRRPARRRPEPERAVPQPRAGVGAWMSLMGAAAAGAGGAGRGVRLRRRRISQR